MWRRQAISAVLLTVVIYLIVGVVYPAVVWGIGQLTMKGKADGSFVTRNGEVVASSLLGQNFSGKDGNALAQYFQPRPSAAGAGYDATASAASNLGPGDARLVGFIPGFNTVDLQGNPSKTNPFATTSDPYCVPTDTDGKAVTSPTADTKFVKNADGTYVCYSSTVPERESAYRELNDVPAATQVPVDAVTASASGLDPDISIGNADLQAARIAYTRHVPVSDVTAIIRANTRGRTFGVLGEPRVNVVAVNLALDNVKN